MNEFDIRPARISDALEIGVVQVTGWKTTYQDIVPEAYLEKLTAEGRAEMWRRSMSSPVPQSHWLVAENPEGKIVGFVAGGRERSGSTEFPGEFFAIYILPEYQGKGIGSALMQGSAQIMIREGLPAALVWVIARNPFRRFYEVLGGVPIGEKLVPIGGVDLLETAYGWQSLKPLLPSCPGRLPGTGKEQL